MKMSRSICVAVDSSEHSKYALTWAINNLVKPEDHVHLLFSLDANSWASLGAAGAGADVLQQVREEAITHAETVLKRLGHILTENKIAHTCELAQGDPRSQLCEFVKDKQCSMLILGSRGMGAIKRALIGSVSDYCVHNAQCPVVVVKAT
eukprot:CFRG6756T1